MTPGVPAADRYTVARYFALVDEGVLHPDDRVELLEGVIVAMSPQNPQHASAVFRTSEALRTVIAGRSLVRVQLPLIVAAYSVPEPDIAVVSGQAADYDHAHPTTALLVVEVADSSLLADRLTKASIYAAAGIPEYWIVNLRDDVIEIWRDPDRAASQYRDVVRVARDGRVSPMGLGDVGIAVDDLLPRR